jgi:hypothetical protein
LDGDLELQGLTLELMARDEQDSTNATSNCCR